MLTIQALSIILGWLALHDLPGVAALPGASTIRHVSSNIDTTEPIANGPYAVSVPDRLRILEPFHIELPKDREDQNEGAALVEAYSASPDYARLSDIYNYPASASADLCAVLNDDTTPGVEAEGVYPGAAAAAAAAGSTSSSTEATDDSKSSVSNCYFDQHLYHD